MNKDKKRCFELETMLQEERAKRINNEKVHAEEIEVLQNRCHSAEQKSLDATKDRISTEEKYNELYNANINLRNNLEIEKSNHASNLKNKSLVADKFGFQK